MSFVKRICGKEIFEWPVSQGDFCNERIVIKGLFTYYVISKGGGGFEIITVDYGGGGGGGGGGEVWLLIA